jgi:hypothetical protein
MQLLNNWAPTEYDYAVTSFLNELCPEELKTQVQALHEAKDWEALDALMIPFYNTPA